MIVLELFGNLKQKELPLQKKTMETNPKILEQLLSLGAGYEIERVEYSVVEILSTQNTDKYGKKTYSQVEIYLQLSKDYPFPLGHKVHSYEARRWRHLDLFEHRCYLICEIPLLKEESTGKIKQLEFSFARPYSGFTQKLEFRILELFKENNNLNATGRLLGEYPQRIQKIFTDYMKTVPPIVKAGKKMAMDETNRKKGHDYMTLFVNLDAEKPEIVDIEEGKGRDTIEKFVQKCENPEEIEHLGMDMSAAFISGAQEYLPHAAITYDKFHVVKLLNGHLSDLETKSNFEKIIEAKNLITENLYKQENLLEQKAFLTFFADWTQEELFSNKISKTIFRYMDGMVQVAVSQITNGILEGINSKIQVLKRIARGFRHFENFKQRVFFAFKPLKFNSSNIT